MAKIGVHDRRIFGVNSGATQVQNLPLKVTDDGFGLGKVVVTVE